MKICTACGEQKPPTEFYKKRGLLDARCKPCFNKILNGARKTDEYREKRRLYSRGARNTPAALERERRHAKKFGASNPDKIAAHKITKRALDAGEIVRPEACDDCGQTPSRLRDGRSAIQGHHDDYSKPLEIRWLCTMCHSAAHRALSQGE